MVKLDGQQVEIVGRHVLIAHLLSAGIEVAEPMRDRGIDLIAFTEGKNGGKFNACPIQLKASTNQSFGWDEKYKDYPDLRIIFVWQATSPKDSEFYCLTYAQVERIVRDMNYKPSGKHWVSTKPSKEVRDLLKKNYEVTVPQDWLSKLGFTGHNQSN